MLRIAICAITVKLSECRISLKARFNFLAIYRAILCIARTTLSKDVRLSVNHTPVHSVLCRDVKTLSPREQNRVP